MNMRIQVLKADLCGQLLMLTPLLLLLAAERRGYAFTTYFSVGLWQLISCYATAWTSRTETGNRRTYRHTLSWTLGVFGIGFLLSSFDGVEEFSGIFGAIAAMGNCIVFLVLVAALLLSPIMAVWYFLICLDDYRFHHDAGTADPGVPFITNIDSTS